MDSTTDEMSTPEKSRDPATIEGDIEKTRSSMSSTLEQLHGKLNPTALKEHALEQLHEAKEAIKADVRAEIADVKTNLRRELAEAKSGFREATIGKVEHMVDDAQQTMKETGNGVLQAMRDNPIPTALVGIGLGWLFVNARSRRSHENTRSGPYGNASLGTSSASRAGRGLEANARRALDAATDGVKSIAHRVGETGEKIEESVETFAHDAGEAASDYAGRAKSSAMTMAHDARDTAVQWEGSVEKTLRDNPLPLGAIALALGLAAGLAIPSTEMEDQMVGPLRDDALDEVEALADQAIGTVEEAAGKLVDGTKPRAAQTGLT